MEYSRRAQTYLIPVSQELLLIAENKSVRSHVNEKGRQRMFGPLVAMFFLVSLSSISCDTSQAIQAMFNPSVSGKNPTLKDNEYNLQVGPKIQFDPFIPER